MSIRRPHLAALLILALIGDVGAQGTFVPKHEPFVRKASEKQHAGPARPEMDATVPQLDFVSAERVRTTRDYIAHYRRTGLTLFTAPTLDATYVQVRRTEPSEIEEHSIWDDIVVVQAGSGSVEAGKRKSGVTGATYRAPGEFRGGAFRAPPTRLRLKAGDIVRIPGGVPHAFVPDTNVPFEYIVIKVRRADRPLRRERR